MPEYQLIEINENIAKRSIFGVEEFSEWTQSYIFYLLFYISTALKSLATAMAAATSFEVRSFEALSYITLRDHSLIFLPC